jgi:hypothetical protein
MSVFEGNDMNELLMECDVLSRQITNFSRTL